MNQEVVNKLQERIAQSRRRASRTTCLMGFAAGLLGVLVARDLQLLLWIRKFPGSFYALLALSMVITPVIQHWLRYEMLKTVADVLTEILPSD